MHYKRIPQEAKLFLRSYTFTQLAPFIESKGSSPCFEQPFNKTYSAPVESSLAPHNPLILPSQVMPWFPKRSIAFRI